MKIRSLLTVLTVVPITLLAISGIENNFIKIDKLISIEINDHKKVDELIQQKKKSAFFAGFIAVEGAQKILWDDIDNDGMSFISTIDQLEAKAKICGFIDKPTFDSIRNTKIPKMTKIEEYNRMRAQIEAQFETTPILLAAYKAGEDMEILLNEAYSKTPRYGTLLTYHEELQKNMLKSEINTKIPNLPPESEIDLHAWAEYYFKTFRTIQESQML